MATTLNSFLQFRHPRATLPFSSSSSSFRRSRPYLLPLALAQDVTPPPTPPPMETTTIQQQQQLTSTASPFSQSLLVAPKPQSQSPASDIPDGSQWRYSEFLDYFNANNSDLVGKT
ncbi:ATP-dependent zinc metalloprotease [Nymphaea thermarum]|nr:ATP-dependent zinc metalloprotease [Nymphaea thermarum]